MDICKEALKEDLGRGDLFSLIAKAKIVEAKIVAKEDGILAGVKYVKKFIKQNSLKSKFYFKDSQKFKKGDILCTINGNSNTILKCERVILNTLMHLCGIATNTNQYVKKLNNKNIKLLDTRKTRPLLRNLEKYAVRCGGGSNHRFGLDDALMIKDTHLKTITNLKKFIKKARVKLPFTSKIEVECENFETAKSALEAKVDIIMCDNMNLKEIEEIVTFRDNNFPLTLIEVSGNISLENIQKYSKINIDAISSGSLIHQARWLDLSMKIGQF